MKRTHLHMKIGPVARDVIVTETENGINIETELGEAHFTIEDRGSGRIVVGLPDGSLQEVLCDREGKTVHVATHGQNFRATRETRPDDIDDESGSGDDTVALEAPMTGSVVEVLVENGATVAEDEVLLVVEAMKMEHRITAPFAGTVSGLESAAGDQVDVGQTLVVVNRQQD